MHTSLQITLQDLHVQFFNLVLNYNQREESTKCTSCLTDDYTFDEDNNKCTYDGTCHSSCKTCSGPKDYECLTCSSGYSLVNGRECISKSQCATYFDEVIGNFRISALDQTQNDQLFNISL